VGYVVEGQIELTIDTTSYTLSTGDSFFFKNHLTNSYRNVGQGTARGVQVIDMQLKHKTAG
jgi:quercetin dioxygenase-like cupin family protein